MPPSSLRRYADVGGTGRLSLAAGVLIAIGLVLLTVAAPNVVALTLVGGLLAYLLQPVVDALERRAIRRSAAAWIVLGALTLVIALLVVLAAPALMEQATALHARWASGEITQLLATAEADLAERFPFVQPGQLGLAEALQSAVSGESAPLVVYAPAAFEAIGNAVLVPFVLFALLKDGPAIRKGLLGLVPNRAFEFAMGVAYKIDAHLGGYLRGQAVVALFVGAGTALGLGLLGVDYYLVLGILTGLANFVPYVGFVVSAALTVAVSMLTTDGYGQVSAVIVLFLVLQTVENVVLQPWITGRNVSLHPALVLGAILVGGQVAGVLGMTLAVPIAAILKVVVVETVVSLRRYHL